MPRSVILLSTPTSANGSLFRVLMAVSAGRYTNLRWVQAFYDEGRVAELATAVPPAEGFVIKHNAPQWFGPHIPVQDYRFVLNARDPRDLLCNQYHWQFSHFQPHETEAETRGRRQRAAEEGIDAFALRDDNTTYLNALLRGIERAAEAVPPEDRIFIGYAMYCLHYDVAVDRLCAFLAVERQALGRESRRILRNERVENLQQNRVWIGNLWAGADTAPGRHRAELRPETIRILTERYRWFLDFLRGIDDPRVADTYD